MPNAITIRNGRCTCDCGDVCPLGRTGMTMRCTVKRLSEHGIQMIQKSPNGWSCLPTAFAMALNQPVKTLIKKLGHDGSQIVWPNRPEPENRRGFHPAELIYYSWYTMWVAVTTYEVFPVLATTDGSFIDWTNTIPAYTIPKAHALLATVLEEVDRGVIGGVSPSGCRHAIAMIRDNTDKPQYLCPNLGKLDSIADFKISHVYILED